jgi:hypothetical protein
LVFAQARIRAIKRWRIVPLATRIDCLEQAEQPQDGAETPVRGQAHSGREPRLAVDLCEPCPLRQCGVVQPLPRDCLLDFVCKRRMHGLSLREVVD